MSQAEVKEAIIHRVQAVKDVGALNEILEFVEGLIEPDARYALTDAQRIVIQRGLADVAVGRVVAHEEAMNRCRNRPTR